MSEIINIGDLAIERKRREYASSKDACDHRHLQFDESGDVVRCVKCGTQVSAFWVLQMLVEQYTLWTARLNRERESVRQAAEASLHLIASRKVEIAWRNRTMVPSCPHCGNGILPEDGLGSSMINRAFEIRRRSLKKSGKT